METVRPPILSFAHRPRQVEFDDTVQKFVANAASHNFVLVNIEGNTDPCSAFNDKHKLTLPHFGLKDKGEIQPFGVKFIPHHVAIGVSWARPYRHTLLLAVPVIVLSFDHAYTVDI